MTMEFTIDRFATSTNTLVPTFNSFFHEINTSGIDAFAQVDYELHYNFINPPFAVIGRLYSFL